MENLSVSKNAELLADDLLANRRKGRVIMKRQTSKTAKMIFSPPDASGNSVLKVIAEEKTEVELEIDVKHDMTMRWILNILDENHIGGTNRHRIIP